jgi:hypothetical protein
LFNNHSLTRYFEQWGGEKQKMDRKIKVLSLLVIVLAAVVGASLVFALQPTATTDSNTNNISSDVSQPALSSVNATEINTPQFGFGHMGFGGSRGIGTEFGRSRGPEGFGQMQVSSDFTANVTSIANNDSDVQNLLSQGYNITSIRPVISTSIDGNGNVIAKATTADLTLQSTNGRAFVVVGLSQAKVTKIVSLTMTEIDK